MITKVLRQQLPASGVIEQWERREVRQVDLAVKDQPRLEPAIGEKRCRHLIV
jgi:hypothetical protein